MNNAKQPNLKQIIESELIQSILKGRFKTRSEEEILKQIEGVFKARKDNNKIKKT